MDNVINAGLNLAAKFIEKMPETIEKIKERKEERILKELSKPSDFIGKQGVENRKGKLESELERYLNDDKLPPANIIVAGITGVGKSTLLNAIFGSELAKTGTGKAVTENIDQYGNSNIPVRIWDTVGLELDYEKTKKSIQAIRNIIADKVNSEDSFDRIHAIWYCISSESKRFQGDEVKFIKELHDLKVPFIIVLTQCSGSEDVINNFENEIRKINNQNGMNDIEIVQVLAKEVKIRGGNVIEPFGLDNLVKITTDKLPEFIKSGFIAAQKVSLRNKRGQCEEIVFDVVEASEKGFWDKIPLVNIGVSHKKITNMFIKIGRIYNTVLSEYDIKRVMEGHKISEHIEWFINPFSMKQYKSDIRNYLESKKGSGFDVKKNDMKWVIPSAIAFYGYSFIDAIESVWNDLTEADLKNSDKLVRELSKRLAENINSKLNMKK